MTSCLVSWRLKGWRPTDCGGTSHAMVGLAAREANGCPSRPHSFLLAHLASSQSRERIPRGLGTRFLGCRVQFSPRWSRAISGASVRSTQNDEVERRVAPSRWGRNWDQSRSSRATRQTGGCLAASTRMSSLLPDVAASSLDFLQMEMVARFRPQPDADPEEHEAARKKLEGIGFRVGQSMFERCATTSRRAASVPSTAAMACPTPALLGWCVSCWRGEATLGQDRCTQPSAPPRTPRNQPFR